MGGSHQTGHSDIDVEFVLKTENSSTRRFRKNLTCYSGIKLYFSVLRCVEKRLCFWSDSSFIFMPRCLVKYWFMISLTLKRKCMLLMCEQEWVGGLPLCSWAREGNVIPVPSAMLSQRILIISSYPRNIITVFLKDIFKMLLPPTWVLLGRKVFSPTLLGSYVNNQINIITQINRRRQQI